MLQTVNSLTAFSQELRPPPGIRESASHLKNTKLAALIAHGTNLGISTMGNSTEAVTVEMLQNVSRHYLNETTGLREERNRKRRCAYNKYYALS